jgi:curved DNA-binding protein CbpA
MESTFVDYYELLQISPNAEAETVQRVFRMLAARYHPDNPRSGDTAKFVLLNQAYSILSDPGKRAQYDSQHALQRSEPLTVFEAQEFMSGIDGEENRRMGILCLLYRRRRSNIDHSGMSILEFENLMALPREHLMFTLWYLKEKDWVRQDERSDYTITGGGIDHVEKNLTSYRVLHNLLQGPSTPESSNTTVYSTFQTTEES